MIIIVPVTKNYRNNMHFFSQLGLMVLGLSEAAANGTDVGVEGKAVAKPSNTEMTEVLRTAFNTTNSKEDSSEEFTQKDLQELRAEMEKENVPKEQIDRITGVFGKFTEGADPAQQMVGFVS